MYQYLFRFSSFLPCLISVVLLGLTAGLSAQNIQPVQYFSFDKTGNPIEPSAFETRGGQLLAEDSPMGNFLRSQPSSKATPMILGPVLPSNGMTLEFLFRLDRDTYQPSTMLFRLHDNSFIANIALPTIDFTTFTRSASGEFSNDYLGVKLRGEGRQGVEYYLDGNWHHIVFKWDGVSGRKEIWIDGELPEGFSRQLATRGKLMATNWRPEGSTLQLNSGCQYGCFWGDLDEIAYYDRFLPEDYHIQHAREALEERRPYSFEKVRRAVPRQIQPAVAEKAPAGIDLREFPPGYPDVLPDVLDQIRMAPGPRFQKGHGLPRNFNWMEARYFAGWQTEGRTKEEGIDRSIALQEMLAGRWNYSLSLFNTGAFYEIKGNSRAKTFLGATIDLANAHPEWPVTATTFWSQVAPATINEGTHVPTIRRQNLDNSMYVHQATGKLLISNGIRSFSPAAPAAPLAVDGKAQAFYLDHILNRLQRPLDMINENGECPPLPYPASTLEKDPRIVRDRLRYGKLSWETYQAIRKTEFRQTYRDEFLRKDPRLAKTRFSWYAVDGGPLARFEWKEARKIGTPFNGQYYSTPDFYVRWPENWEKWVGPWHGWAWLEACRKVEIEAGDHLFSPFVAAGWDRDPEKNVRPSQWLGLLKCTGVIGAEFYYACVFNEYSADKFPLPIHYAWQALTPAYAQAITSRYEDILRNGHLLTDKQGAPILRHIVSDPRVLVVIRKHNTQNRYVISSTLNPYSNVKGNVPDETSIQIAFDGVKLRLNTRRQGSVYLFDNSDPTNPSLVMLDHWHETGHPLQWSEAIILEAEVFDAGKHVNIQTETPSASTRDYRVFTSYIVPANNRAELEYSFGHSQEKSRTYDFAIRMRSQDGKSAELAVYLDDKLVGKLNCGKSKDWQWADGKSCLLGKKMRLQVPPGETHTLRLKGLNLSVAIDQIRLSPVGE